MVGIKDLMGKFVLNRKFKKAGEGRRLGSNSAEPLQDPTTVDTSPSEAARLAAINRIQKSTKPEIVNRSAQAIRRIAKEELAKEKLEQKDAPPVVQQVNIDEEENKIFFECKELFPNLILPKKMLLEKIQNELIEELSQNPLIASCLLFRTFNHDIAAVEKGINLFCRYLTNLKNHSDELAKYGRIREQNKIFKQTLAHMDYVEIVMNAIGFVRTKESEEYVYDFEGDLGDVDMSLDVLMSTEKIGITFSRDMKVFKSQSSKINIDNDLSDSFYEFSAHDVRRRFDQIHVKEETLMTKQMRDKLKENASKIYRYCFVRIKFPDGILLQGTFSAEEKLSDIITFVSECLNNENQSFNLTCTGIDNKFIIESSKQDSNKEKTIQSMGLCPAVLFYFNSQEIKNNFLNEHCTNMQSDLV